MHRAVAGRLYRGERTKDHVVITVHQAPGSYHVLDDGRVNDLARTMPPEDDITFDWGRPNPGTERLAAALLRDALQGVADPGLARMLADEIVVGLPYTEPWVLWSEDLQDWAQAKGAQLPS